MLVSEDGKERIYINTLRERLGDKFEFVMPFDDVYDIDNHSYYEAEYNYQHPVYPDELKVKHRFIAEAFADANNYCRLPDEIISKIAKLPIKEVVADINNIVMYEIGRTYQSIDNRTIKDDSNGSIMHSIVMLSMLNSPDGLETVLEIMRQNSDFADFHLGDLAPEVIPQALYACCKDNMKPMLDYMYTDGFESYLRSNCLDALGMIAINQPERRGEVIEILHHLLISMSDRLPRLEACDGTFAGFVMSLLEDIDAKELIPEIIKVYETDCVDEGVTGTLDDILKSLNGEDVYRNLDRYKITTPDEIYRRIECFN